MGWAVGVVFLPLTFCGLSTGSCRGSWLAVCRGAGVAAGRGTGSGLVSHLRGWAGSGFEQVHPLGLAVPACGQVQGDVPAAVMGGAGGDVDEVAAQHGAAGFGAGEADQGVGGAQQVMGDGGAGKPGGVGGGTSLRPGGPAARRPLRLGSLTRRTISRAVMACPFFEVNAVYSVSAASASLGSRLSRPAISANGTYLELPYLSGQYHLTDHWSEKRVCIFDRAAIWA